jgi:hypothetical protein
MAFEAKKALEERYGKDLRTIRDVAIVAGEGKSVDEVQRVLDEVKAGETTRRHLDTAGGSLLALDASLKELKVPKEKRDSAFLNFIATLLSGGDKTEEKAQPANAGEVDPSSIMQVVKRRKFEEAGLNTDQTDAYLVALENKNVIRHGEYKDGQKRGELVMTDWAEECLMALAEHKRMSHIKKINAERDVIWLIAATGKPPENGGLVQRALTYDIDKGGAVEDIGHVKTR